MTVLAPDFETANERRDSACAVGLAWIADGRVVRRESHLIRPPEMRFAPGNIRVHGILPANVAGEPGFGASGRNNGQVIPTLSRADPDAIVAKHGAAGERFVALLRDSAELLFELARRHGIDAEAEQTGWVQPAHSPGRIRVSEARVRQWSRWGAPVALLDRGEIRAMTRSDAWRGGFWNRSGGHINPLALTRGLVTPPEAPERALP